MIFKYFSIPMKYQHRLLLFGVLGAHYENNTHCIWDMAR
ncbi:hypothetical protein [Legionella norrlandica]